MAKAKWLIDTDILVDHLRGVSQALQFLEHIFEEGDCFISPITVAELYAGVKEGKERHILDQFMHEFQVIPLNAQIAQQGGLYRRHYGKSHGIGLADALIAALAEDLNATLTTLNKKHYPMLQNVHIPYHK